MIEKDFSQMVTDLAHLNGWMVGRWPTWRPTGTDPGWPDLLLLRERLIMVELKIGTGRLSPHQTACINALLAAGIDTRVWRWPDDWDALTAVLARPVSN